MKTAKHPVCTFSSASNPDTPYVISFDQQRHTYRDNEGRLYVSVSSFVKRFFPEFDAQEAAARVSARTGEPVPDILAKWKAKGEAASSFGTMVHAYAESVILGTSVPNMNTEQLKIAAKAVDNAIRELSKTYEFLGAEQIVFDPLYRIAGTIDLPLRHRETGAITVADWKTYEDVSEDGWGRTGLPPIEHVPDSKLARCGCQLSAYGWIIRNTGYVPPETEIETALIHLRPGSPEPAWIPIPYAEAEISDMAEALRAYRTR